MARVEPSYQGIGDVMRSPGVRRAVTRAADRIADEAQRIARAEAYDTGDYADSIHVEVDSSGRRPRARVVASDYKALWIEFGTVDTPKVRTLGRAVEQSKGR